jgi:hypothetical protein
VPALQHSSGRVHQYWVYLFLYLSAVSFSCIFFAAGPTSIGYIYAYAFFCNTFFFTSICSRILEYWEYRSLKVVMPCAVQCSPVCLHLCVRLAISLSPSPSASLSLRLPLCLSGSSGLVTAERALTENDMMAVTGIACALRDIPVAATGAPVDIIVLIHYECNTPPLDLTRILRMPLTAT